jgi:tetratricopeptide (TPR) repeat protein
MVERDDPSPDAAVELAVREAGDERRAPLLRRYLEAAHARYPGHVGVLDALIRQDLERGEPETALARTAETIALRPRDGRLHLARARLLIRVGRYGDAGVSALRAAELSPEVADDAYDVLTLVYTRSPKTSAYAGRLLEASIEAGTATADQIALLARLVLHAGDKARAVTLYEQALDAGSRLAMPRNDLAFLLAESEEDLDRALELAREAMSIRGENPAVADTLGYVYLQSGSYEAAFWQFRQVTREADPPVAEYYYHLGLALMKLERLADARDALAEALRIDPDFPAAADAMREIDGGDVADASGTRPS